MHSLDYLHHIRSCGIRNIYLASFYIEDRGQGVSRHFAIPDCMYVAFDEHGACVFIADSVASFVVEDIQSHSLEFYSA